MSSSLLLRLLLASVCFLASPVLPLKAAIQMEGVATYEVFGQHNRTLLVEEHFSAVVEGDRWFIDTKVVSTQPSIQPQLFCPPTQQAGSDGGDTYYLKVMPDGPNQDWVGWVEPGSIPNMGQSPSACLLWLAYCSGNYLAKTGQQQLKPVWIPSLNENQNRQDKCSMPFKVARNPDSAEFLARLDYLTDGRLDPCNPSHDFTNMNVSPWNAGYTQAVFEVEGMTVVEGKKIPSSFTFRLQAPAFKAIPPGLEMCAKMHAVVTNIMVGVSAASWLPRLSEGRRVNVRDYRFTDVVTNRPLVSYTITNQFYQRTSSIVSQAVHSYKETRPPDHKRVGQ